MALTIAAIASLAGSVVSGIGAAKAAKKQKMALNDWRAKSLKHAHEDEEQQRQELVKQESLLLKAYGGIGPAFDAARREIAGGAQTAKQEAYAIGQQNQGQLKQSMIDRGLTGTSANEIGQRAVAADTARRVGNISQDLGRRYADLTIGKSQAVAAGNAGLAGFYQHKAKIQQGIIQGYQDIVDAYYGVKMGGGQQQGMDFSSLANSIGGIFGSFGGGGGANYSSVGVNTGGGTGGNA